MARTQTAKAGEYELLHDEFHEYDKDEKGRDRDHVATYVKGDIVTLTAEQAERLTTGPLPAFAEPGSLAQAEADRLQAEADALHAKAQDAKSRAAEAAKAKSSGSSSAQPAQSK